REGLRQVEPEPLGGGLEQPANVVGGPAVEVTEDLGSVDPHLKPAARKDIELSADGVVGLLEGVDDGPSEVDPLGPLVADEEVGALLGPVAPLHALLPLERREERTPPRVLGAESKETAQREDGVSRPALTLGHLGGQIERLLVVREGARRLREDRLGPAEVARLHV